MDSEIVMDALPETGVAGRLWLDQFTKKEVSGPVARELALLVNGLSDRLVVAYGNQLKMFRRLKFTDVLYMQLLFLHRAYSSESTHRSTAVTVARWDLLLTALKLGLENFIAGLCALLCASRDEQYAASAPLTKIYSDIMTAFGLTSKSENLWSVDNMLGVRRLGIAMVDELEHVNPATFVQMITASQFGTVVFTLIRLFLP